MPALRTAATALLLSLGACSSTAEAPPPGTSSTAPPSAAGTGTATPSAPPSQPATPTSPEPTFDAAAAYAVVEQLADGIGPREASGPAYRAAADLVASRLADLGYDVTRVPFPVPAGTSWGVRVPAGQSENVVATPRGFDRAAPHRLVGAHLDTVPQAPGAEDNASGVAILLELARMAAASPPALPVVFVAFGAEEPRGPGDALHHFGSQSLVAGLPDAQRAALRGMVSLDRVGVPSDEVAVCTGGRAPGAVQAALLAAAARVAVPTTACTDNRASDHWSFEKAGLDAARLGSAPYPEYHSPGDRPRVVDPAQLHRHATLTWAWLHSPT